MDFDTPGAFALFLSLGAIGIGLIRLAAYKMKLNAETDRKRIESDLPGSVEDFREEVQDALAQQAAQMDDLNERLDFAERLLTKGNRIEGTGDTPSG